MTIRTEEILTMANTRIVKAAKHTERSMWAEPSMATKTYSVTLRPCAPEPSTLKRKGQTA